MNIIELFEKLKIEKSKILSFSAEEIIRIEKQVNVERKINPEIEVNVASNLIEALKNYATEFQFIANTRVLYNFFSKKDYFRDDFPKQNLEVSEDKIKVFIGSFLEEDLQVFFEKKLIENRYDEMNDILEYKRFFPEDVLFKISKKAEGKLDFALSNLHAKESNYAPILYIKQVYFYQFLSHFSTLELDEKVKSLLNVIVDVYNVNKSSEFAGSTMISMSSYAAFDEDLEETLRNNKRVVADNRAGNYKTNDKSSSTFSWRTFGIIIFVLIRVGFYTNKCSSDDRTTTDYENVNYDTTIYEEPPVVTNQLIDRYYLDAQIKIDSFKMFLTDYDKIKIKNVTYNDSIKTGQNPFETVYKDQYVSSSSTFMKFINNSNYDVVLLENSIAFDTINIAKQAYFIKSKQTFKLDVTSNYNRSFNIYAGKRLGSFHNENEKLYVRNGSVVEPRFTVFAINTKDIIKETYKFTNDVVISENNGKVILSSKDSKISSKSFNEIAKDANVNKELKTN